MHSLQGLGVLLGYDIDGFDKECQGFGSGSNLVFVIRQGCIWLRTRSGFDSGSAPSVLTVQLNDANTKTSNLSIAHTWASDTSDWCPPELQKSACNGLGVSSVTKH